MGPTGKSRGSPGEITYLETLCKTGAERASYIANKTLRKVYKKVGLVPLTR